jgi:hypothetical protein
MAISVTADPIEISLSIYSTRSTYPPAPVNPLLNQDFDCNEDSDNPDIPEISLGLTGVWLNKGIVADPITITLSIPSIFVPGILIDASPISIEASFKDADIVTEVTRKNWIKWSGIGNIDFTIGRDNVAGERPLDWPGWIYDLRKLGNKVIAYGENGVSILTPSDKYYGLETIYRIGLHSPQAVTGTDAVHYFIDRKGQLWKLEKTLELLDYSEFFSTLGDLIMSYDVENDLIYICDGTSGYIYSPKSRSLGSGPVNVTGIGTKDGALYVASAGTILTPTFELCTDIYDMGTRRFKTIQSIDVGTDLTETMEASIDYRVSNRVAFSSLNWTPVSLEGVAPLYCYGLEFRFRLRVQTYEYFELDYFKINGLIHNYSYTEHMLRSGFEQR